VYACYELQAIKPKRKYTRRKDPAEVSAVRRAVANKLVEYEGEMIPEIERAWRISGELAACVHVQHPSVFPLLHQCAHTWCMLLLTTNSQDFG
jgi:hypothetical protein